MTSLNDKDKSAETGKNIIRRLLQVSIVMVITALILFVSAGRINWIYAWVYILASLSVIITNALIFPPELISERGRKKENVENWDKMISGILIIPWFAIYLIAGLDIRSGWSSPVPFWIHLSGIITFMTGNAIVTWAMISNAFFSTSVRIQYDRGHTVSSGGPYHYVRHPGYVGMIIYLLSTPFILGSFWALIPAIVTGVLFIVRTSFEDTTLKNKLEGYKEYAQKVPSRLIPGIW